MKESIAQNMTQEPIMVSPRVSLRETQEILQIWGMRHLPVVDDDQRLIGVVSDRDIARAYSARLPGTTAVTEFMTANPYCVFPHTSVGEVAEVMAENKYGCAIIVDAGSQVKGIFTTTDALYVLARLLKRPEDSAFRVLNIADYIRQRQVV